MKKVEAKKGLLWKLVSHDIKCSGYYKIGLFVLPLILILFSCFFLQRDVIRMTEDGRMAGSASLADYLFHFMEGMPVFIAGEAAVRFEIPAVWLIFHWWPSYIISAYVIRDLKRQGVNLLLRVENRKIWWLEKCIWGVLTAVFYYLFMAVVIAGFTLVKGNFSLELHPVLLGLPVDAAESLSGLSILLKGLLVPVCITTGMLLLQLTVIIWRNQWSGNLIFFLLLLFSAYVSTPVLPGNYLMLLRSSNVIGAEGVRAGMGIIMGIFMALVSVWLGVRRFEKMDIS